MCTVSTVCIRLTSNHSSTSHSCATCLCSRCLFASVLVFEHFWVHVVNTSCFFTTDRTGRVALSGPTYFAPMLRAVRMCSQTEITRCWFQKLQACSRWSRRQALRLSLQLSPLHLNLGACERIQMSPRGMCRCVKKRPTACRKPIKSTT